MTVGQALWPDQLSDDERALLRSGISGKLDREPDVLIVGGGMVGCATAAACVRAGLGSVVLLEQAELGAGASGGAAGLLMPETHVGVDPPEYVALMRAGLDGWRELEATWPGGVGLLPFDYRGHAQARVNPLRAITRLAAGLSCVATGVAVQGAQARGRQLRTVFTNEGTFRPRRIVFATGLPPRIDGLDLPLAATEVKGHILASEPTSLVLPADLVDLARTIDDGRILVGGSVDVGDDTRMVRPEVIARMWSELEAAWPAAAGIKVQYRWACFRPAHLDHLPVIDRVPGLGNAWFTSGHYKTGILSAPATGEAIAQWMLSGAPTEEARPFALARFAAHR